MRRRSCLRLRLADTATLLRLDHEKGSSRSLLLGSFDEAMLRWRYFPWVVASAIDQAASWAKALRSLTLGSSAVTIVRRIEKWAVSSAGRAGDF